MNLVSDGERNEPETPCTSCDETSPETPCTSCDLTRFASLAGLLGNRFFHFPIGLPPAIRNRICDFRDVHNVHGGVLLSPGLLGDHVQNEDKGWQGEEEKLLCFRDSNYILGCFLAI